jgi:hypothetical protein
MAPKQTSMVEEKKASQSTKRREAKAATKV